MPPAKLPKKGAWNHQMVTAFFDEHGEAAPKLVAEICAELDIIGKPRAYQTLGQVTDYLLENPDIAYGALVPLLRRILEHEEYNPDGMRHFAMVQNDSVRLLARLREPIVKVCIERWLANFPEDRNVESAAGFAEVMCQAVNGLGDKSLVEPMTQLLDTLIPHHTPRNRKILLERSRSLLKFG